MENQNEQYVNNLASPKQRSVVGQAIAEGIVTLPDGITLDNLDKQYASQLVGYIMQVRNQQQVPQQKEPKQESYVAIPQDYAVSSSVFNDDVAMAVGSKLTELANNNQLVLPKNYNVGNALKNAMQVMMTSDNWSKIQACTEESKIQALTAYVLQGLDALRTHCYFIPYATTLKMVRSYFGDVAVAKRSGVIKDVYAVVIYEGDEIEEGIVNGRRAIVKHTTKFGNEDNPIIGAYAVIEGINGNKVYEIMTINQIRKSWKMSKMQNGKLLTDYQDEASKRTVIRRAIKMFFNATNDLDLAQTAIINSYNQTMSDEYKDEERAFSDLESINANQSKVSGTISSNDIIEQEI